MCENKGQSLPMFLDPAVHKGTMQGSAMGYGLTICAAADTLEDAERRVYLSGHHYTVFDRGGSGWQRCPAAA